MTSITTPLYPPPHCFLSACPACCRATKAIPSQNATNSACFCGDISRAASSMFCSIFRSSTPITSFAVASVESFLNYIVIIINWIDFVKYKIDFPVDKIDFQLYALGDRR